MRMAFGVVLFMCVTARAALEDGLVVDLRFDTDSGGIVEDASGAGNHGYVKGATFRAEGRHGGCFHFDGMDDEVVVSNSAALNPSGALSVAAWVYNEGPGVLNGIVVFKGSAPGGGSGQYGLVAFPLSGGGGFTPSFSLNTTSTSWRDYTSPVATATGVWTHLAGTYVSGRLRLYVDGELKLEQTTVSGSIPSMDGDLYIGAEHSWTREHFKGLIDEVRVYNRALTSNEVAELAGGELPVPDRLAIVPEFMRLGATSAEDLEIGVEASVAWTAEATVPWLEVIGGGEGTTNGTVAFKALANESGAPRLGAIVVSSSGGSRTCHVSQAGEIALSGVVINEIHYNPESDFADREYVELHNRSAEAVDVSGWRFSTGIALTFPAGTAIPGGGFLVVCRNVAALQAAYGDTFAAIGDFTGSLDNAGETLVLLDADGGEVHRIRYGDGAHPAGSDEWPFEPDGSGVSLEAWPDSADLSGPASWGIGQPRTPGQSNRPTFGSCQSIVISEIQYAPLREEERVKFDDKNFGAYLEDGDDDHGEYLEIFNRSAQAVDVSGWAFTSGMDYVFPAGTTLPPGGFRVVAKDPAAVAARHGLTNVLGPFAGALANGGERITLCHANGHLVDAVKYEDEFPWPLAPDDRGYSLECFNPWADNTIPANWRAAVRPLPRHAGTPTNAPLGGFLGNGTPGTTNSVAGALFGRLGGMRRDEQMAYLPAAVNGLVHEPARPRSTDPVVVRAEVALRSSFAEVWLITSQGADTEETRIPMHDDGAHGDGAAGDGIYGAILEAVPTRTFVHYRVQVRDDGWGLSTFAPREDDPSPTQAYFVCDDEIESGMTVFQLYISDPNWEAFLGEAFSGSEDMAYVDCSVAIDGVAYPHVGIRPRGRSSQIQAPYPIKYRFNKTQLWKGNRTFDTMFREPFRSEVAARIYRALGLTELETTLVRLERNGTFHGSYIGYESPTETWLKKHGYPEETELYKARATETAYRPPNINKNSDLYRNALSTDMDYWGAYNKRIRPLEPPTHIRAFVDALDTLSGDEMLAWLDAHVELDAWLLRWGATVFMRIDDFTTHNHYHLLPGGSAGKWSWLGYDYDSMQRGPSLRLFYGDGTGGDNRAWQWNRMCAVVSGNPTLRRLHLLTVRRMLAEHPAASFSPMIDDLWNQLAPDRLTGVIATDPEAVKADLAAQQASMLQALQSFNLPDDSAVPWISPAGGTYTGTVQVALGALPGWDVYVTTNGTDPRLSATRRKYDAAFAVSTSVQVRAAAIPNDTLPQQGQWTDGVRADYHLVPAAVEQALHSWDFNEAATLFVPSATIGGGALACQPGPATEFASNASAQGFDSAHLRVNNPIDSQLTFSLPTVGFENIRFEFLTRRSGQGAGAQTLFYTADGTQWTEWASHVVLDADPQAKRFDFSGLASANHNPNFAIRIAISQGGGGTAGNQRFDDVCLWGTVRSGGGGTDDDLHLEYHAAGVGGDAQECVVVRWPSIAGKRYELRWTEDLLAGFYLVASDLLAQGSAMAFTNQTHGAPRGFFRIVPLE